MSVTERVSRTSTEIASQPGVWREAVAAAAEVADLLPPAKERALLVGCGTSAFVAQAAAGLREQAGHGETDWAYASELAPARSYEHVVAFTRSGTTTEVLSALAAYPQARRVVVTAAPAAPTRALAERVVDLSFADEESVVQTRFPTAVLALWRAVLGEDLGPAIADADTVLTAALPADVARFHRYVYLGRGWTLGLAHEAALKMRECAQACAESYPALDYRHGPVAAADEETLVVSLGGVDDDLLDDVRRTGATVLDQAVDPLARLVTCQRLAVALAEHRGLDPDRPRNLTRSVVLDPGSEETA